MATSKKIEEAPVVDVDLDALIEQKAEARGDDGHSVNFQFKNKVWTFRDPETLTDPEIDELSELTHNIDVASWYMGDDQYDEFVEAGGSANLFFAAFKAHQQKVTAELQGRPTRPNRSSRRSRKR